MLYDIDNKKHEEIPHKKEYNVFGKRLSDEEHSEIISTIHERIENVEIFNASFIAKSNWEDTPLYAIYLACDEDQEQAGLFYGQLCWEAIQRHPDDWIFYKEEGSTLGMTYFRKKS
jgi:hypothetical protein